MGCISADREEQLDARQERLATRQQTCPEKGSELGSGRDGQKRHYQIQTARCPVPRGVPFTFLGSSRIIKNTTRTTPKKDKDPKSKRKSKSICYKDEMNLGRDKRNTDHISR